MLDVRSPSEFRHAHIPNAYSFPLFDDEQRAVVGTLYKQQGRETAIRRGLDYFGPRMRSMVEQAEALLREHDPAAAGPSTPPSVLVHCWRGGMRSQAVAWLLDLYGFRVFTLSGGYKAFRHWVLSRFETARDYRILGGYTGSAKTFLLQELEQLGHRTVDLERLACHRGSAFGDLGQPAQPSQEQFENRLAVALHELDAAPGAAPVWLEDESQRIGSVNLPQALWEAMRAAPLYFLDIPFEQRLDHIVQGYGQFPASRLGSAILRIQKRLGGLAAREALAFLERQDIRRCFAILLEYYDKQYRKSMTNRPETTPVHLIATTQTSIQERTRHLLDSLHLTPEPS